MHPLFAILPAVFLGLCILAWTRRASDRSWLEASLLAALSAAATVVASTEVLSIFTLVSHSSLLLFWSAADGALLWWLCRGTTESPITASSWPAPDKVLVLSLAPGLILTFLVAAVATPNNWDSMAYHLSRVEHWLQGGSVRFYQTSIVRQLQMGPLAEFFVLHLRALAGSSAFANLVQWTAFVGCMAVSASVCRQLGGGPQSQGLAALFVATMPMAILQATSTQTDLVAAFFVLCSVDRAIALHRRGYRYSDGLFLGIAGGAAALTKGTAYLYLFPVTVLLVASNLPNLSARKLRVAALVLGVAFAMNLGQFARNFSANGDFLGRDVGLIATHSSVRQVPAHITSTLIRNVATELESPFHRFNWVVDGVVRRLHRILRLDPDDPATTIGSSWADFFALYDTPFHEDAAGNPWHLMMAAAACGYCLWTPIRRRPVTLYVAVVLAAVLTFVALLRWQPWVNRLHLPLMVMLAPVTGLAWGAAGNRYRQAITIALVLASMPWLLINDTRPLLTLGSARKAAILPAPPSRVLFANRSELLPEYDVVTSLLAINHARTVGLRFGDDSWEYPIWWLAQRKFVEPVLIEHYCLAERPLVTALDPGFSPDFIVSADVPSPSQLDCNGTEYSMVARHRTLTVYASPGMVSRWMHVE